MWIYTYICIYIHIFQVTRFRNSTRAVPGHFWPLTPALVASKESRTLLLLLPLFFVLCKGVARFPRAAFRKGL